MPQGLKTSDILLKELKFLDRQPQTETTLIIFPEQFGDFSEYLLFVKQAERLASRKGYDGIYQLAGFHPDYCFADAAADDAANYTNRSLYPMLHLLREASITKALAPFPRPENIPQRNIRFAREKGLAFMQLLQEACREV